MIHTYLCSQAPDIYVTDTRLIMSVYLSYYIYTGYEERSARQKVILLNRFLPKQ